MVAWLTRDQVPEDALTIEKALVATELASSLAEARRLIGGGGIYVNNEKLTPPAAGMVPVACQGGEPVRVRWDG